jgi:hypothetical protein
MNKYGELTDWQWQGEKEVLAKQPNPVQLSPPQIPHGLA